MGGPLKYDKMVRLLVSRRMDGGDRRCASLLREAVCQRILCACLFVSAPPHVVVNEIHNRSLFSLAFQVSVQRSPSAWWQHAGNCILAECRSRYPVRKLADSLEVRVCWFDYTLFSLREVLYHLALA